MQHALSVGDPFRPAERLRRRGPVPLRLLPEQPELPAVARAVNGRERVPCTPQRSKQTNRKRLAARRCSARRLCGESARSRCLGDGCGRHTSIGNGIHREAHRCRLLLVHVACAGNDRRTGFVAVAPCRVSSLLGKVRGHRPRAAQCGPHGTTQYRTVLGRYLFGAGSRADRAARNGMVRRANASVQAAAGGRNFHTSFRPQRRKVPHEQWHSDKPRRAHSCRRGPCARATS